jgi:hypothetical protein
VKGIKGGILIGEDGEVKIVIDRNRGFYTPQNEIWNFKKMGFKEGEIESIRLLFYRRKEGYPLEFTQQERKRLKKVERVPIEIGVFQYQLIDKNLKLIAPWYLNQKFNVSEWSIFISKTYVPREDRVYYEMYDASFMSEEKAYENIRWSINQYRLNKSKGIVFDPVNFNPDNPEEVSNYIKSLKSKQEGK